MGWMQQVANMPLMEPVTKGLHAFHTGLSDMAFDEGVRLATLARQVIA